MIKVKKLTINNFLSVGLCTIDFSKMGLTLIKGSNGAGKSTIYRKSLEYLLYGRTPEGITGDDYLSDSNQSGLCVSGDFNRDGSSISVRRYRNDDTQGNRLVVEVNGEDISKTDNRETQKVLNDLIGVDYETFESSTCFNNKGVLFAESGASVRSSLLSKMLSLDKYKKAHSKVKHKIGEEQRRIDNINTEYSMVSEGLEKDLNLLESLLQERADSSRRKELEQEIDKLKGETELESRIREHVKAIQELGEEIELLSERKLELHKELSALSTKITRAQSDQHVLETEKICIRCNQKIEETHARKEFKKLHTHVHELQKSRSEQQKRLKTIETNMTELDQSSTEYSIELTRLQSISSRIGDKLEQIKLLDEEESRIQNTIKLCKDNIKIGQGRQKELEDELLKRETHLKFLDFWETGFSRHGIPNLLIEQSLADLERFTNSYLSGTGLVVALSGQRELKSKEKREEVDITIYNNGVERSYKKLSAGEKKRVDIAFLFAIIDLSPNKFNIAIMDEVFDSSLDGAGSEMVMGILRQRSRELDSLLVISHQSTLQDYFDNVIDVKLVNGVSRINGG